MKRIYIIILSALMTVLSVSAQNTLTASQVLSKAVNVVSNAKGVEAKFSVSGSGYSGNGEIKTLGQKFIVSLPDVSVWYNGTNLYTYNKKVGETTLIKPTADELAQTNPLAYITGAQANYNAAFSNENKAGKYVLELIPKTKKGMIKKITITLDKNSFQPEKLVIEPKSGSSLTAVISSYKTGVAISENDFEYPRAKYPNVEVVDLR